VRLAPGIPHALWCFGIARQSALGQCWCGLQHALIADYDPDNERGALREICRIRLTLEIDLADRSRYPGRDGLPMIRRLLCSPRHGFQVKHLQFQRSRSLNHADQTALPPRLAPLTGYQKSNQAAAEDALNCAHSRDAVSCRSLRGFGHFRISSNSLISEIAENEDDRIEMNQTGSAVLRTRAFLVAANADWEHRTSGSGHWSWVHQCHASSTASKIADSMTSMSFSSESGYRFASRKRVKTQSRVWDPIQSEPTKRQTIFYGCIRSVAARYFLAWATSCASLG
jgi:hypothetical protein